MNDEKATLVKEIKAMMGNRGSRSSGYNSLTVHKILDKLFLRSAIILILIMLGYVIIKGYKKESIECPK